jgi:EAL domain-containing protein (putative c-di-GMP-specific phosphodiesterase class I)/GGDEF domain-containing protein
MLVVEDTLGDERFTDHPLVNGEPYVRSYAGSVIRGRSGQALGTLCIMDTTHRRFSQSDLEVLAQLTRILEHELESRANVADLRRKMRDHLLLDSATQLPTEALFTTRLAAAMHKHTTTPIALAVIRLERFDSVHSAVGKPGASLLVRQVATRLNRALQRQNLMGRLREDKIVVAFLMADGREPTTEVNQIIDCFARPFFLGDHTLAQSVAIGTAIYPRDGHDCDVLLKRAATALNSIPPSEISTSRQYQKSLSAEAARQFEIETSLRGAIDRDELELVYQPRCALDGLRLTGAEALLRWTTPKLGQVGPAEFVPIAEESGLIVQLGEWALRDACRQIAAWQADGYDCPEISVNVSSVQLRQQTFCDRVEKLLAQFGVAGSKLNFELTEGTLIENINEAIRLMNRLRKLGISFSIDDFGKGFSSLSYLARMPVQVLKIDREFIRHIPEHHTSLTLVRSIIGMAHGLELAVVAEGVESPEQLDALREYGCDEIQGFLISPPLDTTAFASRYLTQTRPQQACIN